VKPLRQGQIVWAMIPDRHGNRAKRRPVIVLTPNEDIATHDEIACVVASHTSALQNPRPGHYVPIPYHPRGACRTKLRKETVAVCDWMTTIPNCANEEDIAGCVSKMLLLDLIKKVGEYCG